MKWALNAKIGDLEYIRTQDHRSAIERKKTLGEEWDRIYKFTIIRNPWDRAVSLYHKHQSKKSFEDWLIDTDINQARYFTEDGQAIVDDVFRFEDLSQSIDAICDRAGWPKIEPRRVNDIPHDNYRTYYSTKTIDLVAEKEHWLIDHYGYYY